MPFISASKFYSFNPFFKTGWRFFFQNSLGHINVKVWKVKECYEEKNWVSTIVVLEWSKQDNVIIFQLSLFCMRWWPPRKARRHEKEAWGCFVILYYMNSSTCFHGLKPLKRMLFESIFQLILHTKRVNNTESRHGLGQGIQAFLKCKSKSCSETQNCKIWLFCYIVSW